MEKAITYFLGVGAIVYIIVVGVYISQTTDAVGNETPHAISTDESLLKADSYIDEQKRFSLRVPYNWEIDNDRAKLSGAIFSASAGRGSEELRIIRITKESTTLTDSKITLGKLSDFMYYMKSAKVSSSTLVSLHGKNARLLEATLTINNILYREYALFVVKDKHPYIISGMARDSLWNNYKDEILAAILSFEVK